MEWKTVIVSEIKDKRERKWSSPWSREKAVMLLKFGKLKKKKNPKNFRSFKTVFLFLDFIRLLPSFILTEKVCTFFILFYLSFYFWFSFASKRSANEKILVCFSRFSFSSPIWTTVYFPQTLWKSVLHANLARLPHPVIQLNTNLGAALKVFYRWR